MKKARVDHDSKREMLTGVFEDRTTFETERHAGCIL